MPIRVIACITLVAFLFTSIPADLVQAAVSESRPKSESNQSLDVNSFYLPPELGTIQSSWYSSKLPTPTSKLQTIIHIQDAHCNYSAQRKIADIIEHLNKAYGIKLVNLEGGKGDYDLSIFKAIDDNARREQIADRFVKEGLINGAEYFAAKNLGKVKLWGIEDDGLYLENLRVYRKSLAHKSEINKYLATVSRILSSLKMHIYSKELLEFDSRFAQHKAGNLDFKAYVSALLEISKQKGIGTSPYQNIEMLEQVVGKERDIDFAKANSERDQLIETLRKALSYRETAELLQKTVEFSSRKITQASYYAYIYRKCKELGIDTGAFQNFEKYLAYVELFNKVDNTKVMDEVASLEREIKAVLCENDTQRELDTLSRNLAIAKNIFNVTLTRDDYRYYRSNESSFETAAYASFINRQAPRYKIDADMGPEAGNIDRYREEISKFYELSMKRDDAFVKNLRFQSPDNPVAIIVTGGFHGDNLRELFKKNGISYVSIMPNFRIENGYESPYFKLLAGNPYAEFVKTAQSLGLSSLAIASNLNPLGKQAAAEAGMPLSIAKPVETIKPAPAASRGQPTAGLANMRWPIILGASLWLFAVTSYAPVVLGMLGIGFLGFRIYLARLKTPEERITFIIRVQCLMTRMKLIDNNAIRTAVAGAFGVNALEKEASRKIPQIFSAIERSEDRGEIITDIIKAIKNYTLIPTFSFRYAPLAMAVVNQAKGRDVFDRQTAEEMASRDSALKYLVDKYPVFVLPEGVDPAKIPAELPSLRLPAIGKNTIRWLDIGSAPKGDGAPTLNLLKKTLSKELNVEIYGTDILFPIYELRQDGTIGRNPGYVFDENGKCQVNGVNYLDAKIAENDVTREGFNAGQFDYASMCAVLHHLSFGEKLSRGPLANVNIVDERGQSLTERFMLAPRQRMAITNVLKSLAPDGVFFLNITLPFEAGKEGMGAAEFARGNRAFLVIRRTGKDMFTLYNTPIYYDVSLPSVTIEKYFFAEVPYPAEVAKYLGRRGIKEIYPGASKETYDETRRLFRWADALMLRFQKMYRTMPYYQFSAKDENALTEIFDKLLIDVPYEYKKELLSEVVKTQSALETGTPAIPRSAPGVALSTAPETKQLLLWDDYASAGRIDLSLDDAASHDLAVAVNAALGGSGLEKHFPYVVTTLRGEYTIEADSSSDIYQREYGRVERLGPLVFVILNRRMGATTEAYTEEIAALRERLAGSEEFLKHKGNVFFVAPTYYDGSKALPIGYYALSAIAHILSYAGKFQDAVVFDEGSGDGLLARIALRLGASRVVLIDSGAQNLERARILLAEDGLGRSAENAGRFALIERDLTDSGLKELAKTYIIPGTKLIAIANIGPHYDEGGARPNDAALKLLADSPELELVINGGHLTAVDEDIEYERGDADAVHYREGRERAEEILRKNGFSVTETGVPHTVIIGERVYRPDRLGRASIKGVSLAFAIASTALLTAFAPIARAAASPEPAVDAATNAIAYTIPAPISEDLAQLRIESFSRALAEYSRKNREFDRLIAEVIDEGGAQVAFRNVDRGFPAEFRQSDGDAGTIYFDLAQFNDDHDGKEMLVAFAEELFHARQSESRARWTRYIPTRFLRAYFKELILAVQLAVDGRASIEEPAFRYKEGIREDLGLPQKDTWDALQKFYSYKRPTDILRLVLIAVPLITVIVLFGYLAKKITAIARKHKKSKQEIAHARLSELIDREYPEQVRYIETPMSRPGMCDIIFDEDGSWVEAPLNAEEDDVRKAIASHVDSRNEHLSAITSSIVFTLLESVKRTRSQSEYDADLGEQLKLNEAQINELAKRINKAQWAKLRNKKRMPLYEKLIGRHGLSEWLEDRLANMANDERVSLEGLEIPWLFSSEAFSDQATILEMGGPIKIIRAGTSKASAAPAKGKGMLFPENMVSPIFQNFLIPVVEELALFAVLYFGGILPYFIGRLIWLDLHPVLRVIYQTWLGAPAPPAFDASLPLYEQLTSKNMLRQLLSHSLTAPTYIIVISYLAIVPFWMTSSLTSPYGYFYLAINVIAHSLVSISGDSHRGVPVFSPDKVLRTFGLKKEFTREDVEARMRVMIDTPVEYAGTPKMISSEKRMNQVPKMLKDGSSALSGDRLVDAARYGLRLNNKVNPGGILLREEVNKDLAILNVEMQKAGKSLIINSGLRSLKDQQDKIETSIRDWRFATLQNQGKDFSLDKQTGQSRSEREMVINYAIKQDMAFRTTYGYLLKEALLLEDAEERRAATRKIMLNKVEANIGEMKLIASRGNIKNDAEAIADLLVWHFFQFGDPNHSAAHLSGGAFDFDIYDEKRSAVMVGKDTGEGELTTMLSRLAKQYPKETKKMAAVAKSADLYSMEKYFEDNPFNRNDMKPYRLPEQLHAPYGKLYEMLKVRRLSYHLMTKDIESGGLLPTGHTFAPLPGEYWHSERDNLSASVLVESPASYWLPLDLSVVDWMYNFAISDNLSGVQEKLKVIRRIKEVRGTDEERERLTDAFVEAYKLNTPAPLDPSYRKVIKNLIGKTLAFRGMDTITPASTAKGMIPSILSLVERGLNAVGIYPSKSSLENFWTPIAEETIVFCAALPFGQWFWAFYGLGRLAFILAHISARAPPELGRDYTLREKLTIPTFISLVSFAALPLAGSLPTLSVYLALAIGSIAHIISNTLVDTLDWSYQKAVVGEAQPERPQDVPLNKTAFYNTLQNMLAGQTLNIPAITPEMESVLMESQEGRDLAYNYDRIEQSIKYLFKEMDPQERQIAFSFVQKFVDKLSVKDWNLNNFEDLSGMRALLRNLLIAAYNTKGAGGRFKRIVRGIAYGVGIYPLIMEHAICVARLHQRSPSDYQRVSMLAIPDICAPPEGVDERRYYAILATLFPHYYTYDAKVRFALAKQVLHKMEPEGSQMVAYTAPGLSYVVKVMKKGGVNNSNQPLVFERDIVPGTYIARTRLGGLAANVHAMRNVKVRIDDQDVEFEDVLIQTKTTPLRNKLKELASRGDADAQKEAARIIRKWWDLQVTMWRRGVVDADIKLWDNYGYDAASDSVFIFDYTNISVHMKDFWNEDWYQNILDTYNIANLSMLNGIGKNIKLGEIYANTQFDVLRENNVTVSGWGPDAMRVSVWPTAEQQASRESYIPLSEVFAVDSRELGDMERKLQYLNAYGALADSAAVDTELSMPLLSAFTSLIIAAKKRRAEIIVDNVDLGQYRGTAPVLAFPSSPAAIQPPDTAPAKGILVSVENLLQGFGIDTKTPAAENFWIPAIEEGIMFFFLSQFGVLAFLGARTLFVLLHTIQDRAPPAGTQRTLYEKVAIPLVASIAAGFFAIASTNISYALIAGLFTHMLGNTLVDTLGWSYQKAVVENKASTDVNGDIINDAIQVATFLAPRDPLPIKADAIIVFGNDRLETMSTVAQLVAEGRSDVVVFSGGIGRLTDGLRLEVARYLGVDPSTLAGDPEAKLMKMVFDKEVLRFGLSDERLAELKFILEDRSTDTQKNVQETRKELDKAGLHPQSVILVQQPLGQLRAMQTFRKNFGSLPSGKKTMAYSYAAYLPGPGHCSDPRYVQEIISEAEKLEDYTRPEKEYLEPLSPAGKLKPEIRAAVDRLKDRVADMAGVHPAQIGLPGGPANSILATLSNSKIWKTLVFFSTFFHEFGHIRLNWMLEGYIPRYTRSDIFNGTVKNIEGWAMGWGGLAGNVVGVVLSLGVAAAGIFSTFAIFDLMYHFGIMLSFALEWKIMGIVIAVPLYSAFLNVFSIVLELLAPLFMEGDIYTYYRQKNKERKIGKTNERFQISERMGPYGHVIDGGKSTGRSGEEKREKLVVDSARDPVLRDFYSEFLHLFYRRLQMEIGEAEFRKYVDASSRSKRRDMNLPGTIKGSLVRLVFDTVMAMVSYDGAYARKLEAEYRGKWVLLSDAALTSEKGVCRHQALVCAFLLEKLIDKGLLRGQVYYRRVLNHAWTEYRDSAGNYHVLDIAAKKFKTYSYKKPMSPEEEDITRESAFDVTMLRDDDDDFPADDGESFMDDTDEDTLTPTTEATGAPAAVPDAERFNVVRDFSTAGKGAPRAIVNLNEIVREAQSLLESEYRAIVRFDLSEKLDAEDALKAAMWAKLENLQDATTSPEWAHRNVMDLIAMALANALYFTNQPGLSITVKTFVTDDGWPAISISDTGPGLDFDAIKATILRNYKEADIDLSRVEAGDKEYLMSFLFDYIFSTKPAVSSIWLFGTEESQGMGKALHSMREIVSESGGKIGLETEKGKGTTITFAFAPAAAADTRQSQGRIEYDYRDSREPTNLRPIDLNEAIRSIRSTLEDDYASIVDFDIANELDYASSPRAALWASPDVGPQTTVSKKIAREHLTNLIRIVLANALHLKDVEGFAVTIRTFLTEDGQPAVSIRDTGGGIDFEKVRDTVLENIRKGFYKMPDSDIAKIKAMDKKYLLNLLFEMSLTTKDRADMRLMGKKESQGVGVGLSVVQEIMEQSRGRINVETEGGVGTTFTFTFKPYSLTAPTAAPKSGKPSSPSMREEFAEEERAVTAVLDYRGTAGRDLRLPVDINAALRIVREKLEPQHSGYVTFEENKEGDKSPMALIETLGAHTSKSEKERAAISLNNVLNIIRLCVANALYYRAHVTVRSFTTQDGRPAISIIDDGPGINFSILRDVVISRIEKGQLEENSVEQVRMMSDKELLPMIFETGVTTKFSPDVMPLMGNLEPQGRGMGLGIAASIIKRSKGEIRIESEKEIGTTLTFIFEPYAEPVDHQPKAVDTVAGQRIKGIYAPAKEVLINTRYPDEPRIVCIPISKKICPSDTARKQVQEIWKDLRAAAGEKGFNNITVLFYDGTLKNLNEKLSGLAAAGTTFAKANTLAYIDASAAKMEPEEYSRLADMKAKGQISMVREAIPQEGTYISVGGHVILALGILDIVRNGRSDPYYISLVANLAAAMSDGQPGTKAEDYMELLKKGDIAGIILRLPPAKKIDINADMEAHFIMEETAMKSL